MTAVRRRIRSATYQAASSLERLGLEAGDGVAGTAGLVQEAGEGLGLLVVGHAHAVVGRPSLQDLVALGPEGGGRVRPRAGMSLDDQHARHQGCSRDGAIAG